MDLKKVVAVLIMLIFPSLSFAGAAYYVDCSAASNGTGTFARPFNSLSAVNSAKSKFAPGDGLYFKVNTKCTLNSNNDLLRVTWSGTSEHNRVVIGAYHKEGGFGLGGHNRPIINGKHMYPGDYQGGVYIKNGNYVTIKDLRFESIGHSDAKSPKSVMVNDSKNINVDNCYFYRSSYGSIEYARVKTGIISNNVIEQSGYPKWARTGAAIELTAANIPGATTNILVTHNKVFNSKHEGIGLYKNVTHSIVEYNIVRDVRSYFIYNGSSKYNIFRYNLVYESTQNIHSSFASPRSSYAFASDIEEWRTGERFNGENEWYGNLIAGTRRGFSFSCNIKSGDNDKTIVCHPNEKVYNNTIVDTDTAFNFSGTGSGDKIIINNNISWVATNGIGSTHVGVGGYSAPGVIWSKNLFHGGPAITGKAATDMITEDPRLVKKSGWRSITGELTGSEFLPGPNGITLIDGANFSSHDKPRIYEADYTSKPIKVKIMTPVKPIIGAYVGEHNIIQQPARVERFRISSINK